MTPSVNHVYNIRRRNRKRYTKQTYDMAHMAHIIHHAMKQVSIKRILKKWGDQVDYKMSKEIKQIHTREAFIPLDPHYMAEE